MTRKHPDRRMMIPLSREERDALRGLARGGSLGDALRRLVEAGLRAGKPNFCAELDMSGAARLPLQLPRQARRAVDGLAQREGCRPEAVVCALMHSALVLSHNKS